MISTSSFRSGSPADHTIGVWFVLRWSVRGLMEDILKTSLISWSGGIYIVGETHNRGFWRIQVHPQIFQVTWSTNFSNLLLPPTHTHKSTITRLTGHRSSYRNAYKVHLFSSSTCISPRGSAPFPPANNNNPAFSSYLFFSRRLAANFFRGRGRSRGQMAKVYKAERGSSRPSKNKTTFVRFTPSPPSLSSWYSKFQLTTSRLPFNKCPGHGRTSQSDCPQSRFNPKKSMPQLLRWAHQVKHQPPHFKFSFSNFQSVAPNSTSPPKFRRWRFQRSVPRSHHSREPWRALLCQSSTSTWTSSAKDPLHRLKHLEPIQWPICCGMTSSECRLVSYQTPFRCISWRDSRILSFIPHFHAIP